MEEAVIYIHIYEDEVNYMTFKGNTGKGGFNTLEEARKSFDSLYDRINCKVETVLHLLDKFYD